MAYVESLLWSTVKSESWYRTPVSAPRAGHSTARRRTTARTGHQSSRSLCSLAKIRANFSYTSLTFCLTARCFWSRRTRFRLLPSCRRAAIAIICCFLSICLFRLRPQPSSKPATSSASPGRIGCHHRTAWWSKLASVGGGTVAPRGSIRPVARGCSRPMFGNRACENPASTPRRAHANMRAAPRAGRPRSPAAESRLAGIKSGQGSSPPPLSFLGVKTNRQAQGQAHGWRPSCDLKFRTRQEAARREEAPPDPSGVLDVSGAPSAAQKGPTTPPR